MIPELVRTPQFLIRHQITVWYNTNQRRNVFNYTPGLVYLRDKAASVPTATYQVLPKCTETWLAKVNFSGFFDTQDPLNPLPKHCAKWNIALLI